MEARRRILQHGDGVGEFVGNATEFLSRGRGLLRADLQDFDPETDACDLEDMYYFNVEYFCQMSCKASRTIMIERLKRVAIAYRERNATTNPAWDDSDIMRGTDLEIARKNKDAKINARNDMRIKRQHVASLMLDTIVVDDNEVMFLLVSFVYFNHASIRPLLLQPSWTHPMLLHRRFVCLLSVVC